MSVRDDLFTALAGIVGNRCYPNVFPQAQEKDQGVPVWPAIRYTIRSTFAHDLCGDGGDEVADVEVQIDIVGEDDDELSDVLRPQVLTAMQAFDPPALCEYSFSTFDLETRTHRHTLVYTVYPSSAG